MRLLAAGNGFFGIVLVLVLFGSGTAAAQTWQWHALIRAPGRAPLEAQSRVQVSPRDVVLTYSAQVQHRTIPIASCRAQMDDIASVRALRGPGHAYLLVQLKPQRVALCDSGNQPIAIVPLSDDRSAMGALAAIDRACCAQPVAAKPSVSPEPSPTPQPPLRVVDWVENEGLFAFVRVQNRSNKPVTITAGLIDGCRNVHYGCGPFADRAITLEPSGVATLATVMGGNAADGPAFSYRYDARSGAGNFTGRGSSRTLPTVGQSPMPLQEVRLAEAVAIAGDRTRTVAAPSPLPPAFVAAQLMRRGSSRLGVGQTGVARVLVTISANGMPEGASIVSISNRRLVAAALETAVSSTYAPAMRDGRRVNGSYVATFQFDGDDPALSSIPLWRRNPATTPSPVSTSSPAVAQTPTTTPAPAVAPPAPTVTPAAVPEPSAANTPSPGATPA